MDQDNYFDDFTNLVSPQPFRGSPNPQLRRFAPVYFQADRCSPSPQREVLAGDAPPPPLPSVPPPPLDDLDRKPIPVLVLRTSVDAPNSPIMEMAPVYSSTRETPPIPPKSRHLYPVTDEMTQRPTSPARPLTPVETQWRHEAKFAQPRPTEMHYWPPSLTPTRETASPISDIRRGASPGGVRGGRVELLGYQFPSSWAHQRQAQEFHSSWTKDAIGRWNEGQRSAQQVPMERSRPIDDVTNGNIAKRDVNGNAHSLVNRHSDAFERHIVPGDNVIYRHRSPSFASDRAEKGVEQRHGRSDLEIQTPTNPERPGQPPGDHKPGVNQPTGEGEQCLPPQALVGAAGSPPPKPMSVVNRAAAPSTPEAYDRRRSFANTALLTVVDSVSVEGEILVFFNHAISIRRVTFVLTYSSLL